jgi:hypothetical protein
MLASQNIQRSFFGLQGDERFDEIFDEFRHELISMEEVNEGQLQDLQRQAGQLRQKVELLQKKPNK